MDNFPWKRFAVLASGDGTNFEALIKKVHKDESAPDICGLICDKPGARVLQRAEKYNIPYICIPKKDNSREEHEKLVAHAIKKLNAQFVVLAGYMRILSPYFLNEFTNRIINTHPSLLPAFKGLDAVKQAYDYGVKVAGCTVHIVTAEMDAGPIMAQKSVYIKPETELLNLKHNILRQEHILLPASVKAFAQGNWRIEGNKFIWESRPNQ